MLPGCVCVCVGVMKEGGGGELCGRGSIKNSEALKWGTIQEKLGNTDLR